MIEQWRSTDSMTRRHLWRGVPKKGMGTVETRCNKDPAFFDQLSDTDKPRCKNCIKVCHRCARCGGHLHPEPGANALSRKDSETEICTPCEALEAGNEPWFGGPYWKEKS